MDLDSIIMLLAIVNINFIAVPVFYSEFSTNNVHLSTAMDYDRYLLRDTKGTPKTLGAQRKVCGGWVICLPLW